MTGQGGKACSKSRYAFWNEGTAKAEGFPACPTCGVDRLLPFSCKGRGFCPSCTGRRMSDTAAHLVDRVFPEVPVRQWVLSRRVFAIDVLECPRCGGRLRILAAIQSPDAIRLHRYA